MGKKKKSKKIAVKFNASYKASDGTIYKRGGVYVIDLDIFEQVKKYVTVVKGE